MRGLRGYPAATVAFYGPTADFATKLVAGLVAGEHHDPDLKKWFTKDTDIRFDRAIAEEVTAFLQEHGCKSVAMTDGNHRLSA